MGHGVRKNKKSKRVTSRLRNKVIKKVKEHNRKLTRDKRKNPLKYAKKSKITAIPNSMPFKSKLVNEMDLFHEMEKNSQRRRIICYSKMKRENALNGLGSDVAKLLKDANRRENIDNRMKRQGLNEYLAEKSTKSYYKEFKKVVEAADVILEVLDARDPEGCRCTAMEEVVTSQPGKRLVLILNKADLVPRDNLESWLVYLRTQLPTIVFKSSTQDKSKRLGHANESALNAEISFQSNKCFGADVLMKLLKNYCRNNGIKTAITVGVVGLPNVGKSSLINSMKRTKSCVIGAKPGVTKSMQEVHLDSKVRLLDCPGLILPGGTDASAALRNSYNVTNLSDPTVPVEAIVSKASKKQLMLHYHINYFNDANEFLIQIAKRLGKVKKGAVPDLNAAAIAVLHDWNSGRIKYYTVPPSQPETVSVSLVKTLGKEFSVEEVTRMEKDLMNTSFKSNFKPSCGMAVTSLGPVRNIQDSMEGSMKDSNQENTGVEVGEVEMEEEEAEVEVQMEEEGEEEMDIIEEGSDELLSNVQITSGNIEASNQQSDTEAPRNIYPPSQKKAFDPKTMSMKKFLKETKKKERKEKNRTVRKVDNITESMASLSGVGNNQENYDFNEFF